MGKEIGAQGGDIGNAVLRQKQKCVPGAGVGETRRHCKFPPVCLKGGMGIEGGQGGMAGDNHSSEDGLITNGEQTFHRQLGAKQKKVKHSPRGIPSPSQVIKKAEERFLNRDDLRQELEWKG